MDERERRTLWCCDPVRVPFPSGITWAHSNRCTARDMAGRPRRQQKVLESEWMPERHCTVHTTEGYLDCRECEAIAEDIIQGDQFWEVTNDERSSS
jgi:hypothetical protein